MNFQLNYEIQKKQVFDFMLFYFLNEIIFNKNQIFEKINFPKIFRIHIKIPKDVKQAK